MTIVLREMSSYALKSLHKMELPRCVVFIVAAAVAACTLFTVKTIR